MRDHVDGGSGAAFAGSQSWYRRRKPIDDHAPSGVTVGSAQQFGDGSAGLSGCLHDVFELSLHASESRPDEVRMRFYTLDVEVEKLAEDRLQLLSSAFVVLLGPAARRAAYRCHGFSIRASCC
jgi:hypothetical protein